LVERLRQTCRVDPYQAAQVASAGGRDPLLGGAAPHRAESRLEQLLDGNSLLVKRQPAGLDPRQVEDTVQDAEQVHAGIADIARVLRRVGLPRCGLDDFGKADDRVERRAQFVCHVGEELGLGAVGLLRLAHRFLGERGGAFGPAPSRRSARVAWFDAPAGCQAASNTSSTSDRVFGSGASIMPLPQSSICGGEL
jgi:hypothetical protein